MNVFVTGGTGFVGRAVLRRLLEAGHTIRLLVRNPDSRKMCAFAGSRIELHTGDIQRPETLESALDGVDAIIHLVGIISECGSATFEKVHVRGAQNLLSAARKYPGLQFLHMSALGTRPGAVSRYHQTKWAAEEAVRQSGSPFTIFRPSIIYGREDAFVNLYRRIVRMSPIVPLFGSGKGTVQPVPVDFAGQCFVRALGSSAAVGQTYDVVGPEVFTFEQLIDGILSALDKNRIKIRIPMAPARAIVGVIEFVFTKWLRRPPPLNLDQLIMIEERTIGNGEPIARLLGETPPTFAAGLRDMLSAVRDSEIR